MRVPIEDLPPLSDRQRIQLRNVVSAWAERHANPDRPLLGFGGTRLLSPRELARALDTAASADAGREGPDADAFHRLVRVGMAEFGFERIISGFRSEFAPGRDQ